MRWPSAGSSPVVSVSSTISRIMPPRLPHEAHARRPVPPALAAHHFDDMRDPAQAVPLAEPGFDHEMRAPALLAVRHLTLENALETLERHARTGQHPLGLDKGGCRHHHHGIAAPRAPVLEEKRDVEDDEPRALCRPAAEEAPLARAHEGVNDAFEPREGGRLIEDDAAERLAIDHAVHDRAGKGRGDERDRSTAL